MSSKQVIWLFAAMAVFASPTFGQSNTAGTSDDALLNQRFALLSELQSLGARAKLLDAPLARALAQAEVADAAWFIDRELAKQLLREAYDLASPGEEEQAKMRKRPVGSPPYMPRASDTARANVQSRVMVVAQRDKLFAAELLQSLTEKVGPYESMQTFTNLAHDAISKGILMRPAITFVRPSMPIQLRSTRPTKSVASPLKIARLRIRRLLSRRKGTGSTFFAPLVYRCANKQRYFS